jgi:hypothetical protein
MTVIVNLKMSATEERYVFECEWFDELASLIRKYLFTFYPKNSNVEMVSTRRENFAD